MHRDIDEILFDAPRIAARVQELGRQISAELGGEDLVLLALLKGGVVFLSDLIRAIDAPLTIDFAQASSYGDGTESRGSVQLHVFPDADLRGRRVLIVDDILDTGRTLAAVGERLRGDFGVADVRTCVLLDKPARRVVPVAADYVGFSVADRFVVGYGLDFDELYRNLPFIAVLKPEVFAHLLG